MCKSGVDIRPQTSEWGNVRGLKALLHTSMNIKESTRNKYHVTLDRKNRHELQQIL